MNFHNFNPCILYLSLAQRSLLCSASTSIRNFSIRCKRNPFYVRYYSTSNTNIRSEHTSKFIASLLNAFNINTNNIINNKESKERIESINLDEFETVFIPKYWIDFSGGVETCAKTNNIEINKSSFGSSLVIIFLYIFIYIYFFISVIFFTFLFNTILLSKYFKDLIPVGSLLNLKNKTNIREKIKLMFTKEYLVIIIPTTILILTINSIYFYLKGYTIISMSSSYIAIYSYCLIISIFFNLIFSYINKVNIFTNSNIFNLFYFSIIMFMARISMFQTLPLLIPVLFIYAEKYVVTEDISKLNSNVIKFVKGFLCHVPILNKFSTFFNKISYNFINIDVHKQRYSNILAYKSKLFIAKHRLSITLNFIPFNNRADNFQINPMLSKQIFKSFIIVYNKAYNFSNVYSLSVNNSKCLDTSIVHIKKVGVLRGYFSNSKINFLKITSVKSNLIELKKNVFILHDGNLNFSKASLRQALKCIQFNSSKNNYSLIKNQNYVNKAIMDNPVDFTEVFIKKNSAYSFPFNNKFIHVKIGANICNKKDLSNSFLLDDMSKYIDNVTRNIPSEMLNPLVFMNINQDINIMPKDKGKGVESIQDSYLPDAESLERAFKEYKGWDEGNVFDLVSEQAEYISACLFFNDLDRVSFALNSAESNKKYLMHDGELRKAFYKFIEPLVSQYISFFDEEDGYFNEEGGHFNDCIQSLRDLFTYLMTDEYREMSAYIDKLGEELGVKFVQDKDMLWLDEFRFRVLIRENLHNFFIRMDQFQGETNVLEKTKSEINKDKHKISVKIWKAKNKDKVLAINKKWRDKVRDINENKRQKKDE